MEITPENLERLGFKKDYLGTYEFVTHIDMITVDFNASPRENLVQVQGIKVPHAKTIEHIQQLMHLFIGMPEKEETLLDKITSLINDLMHEGRTYQVKALIAEFPHYEENSSEPKRAQTVRQIAPNWHQSLYEKLLKL